MKPITIQKSDLYKPKDTTGRNMHNLFFLLSGPNTLMFWRQKKKLIPQKARLGLLCWGGSDCTSSVPAHIIYRPQCSFQCLSVSERIPFCVSYSISHRKVEQANKELQEWNSSGTFILNWCCSSHQSTHTYLAIMQIDFAFCMYIQQ